MTHTILLIQLKTAPSSRTYADFEDTNGAWAELVRLFENELKRLNPTVPELTYGIEDLLRWIDSLPDLGALTYSAQKLAYDAHDRKWIKDKVRAMIVKQVK
jgi:hypothetical protein